MEPASSPGLRHDRLIKKRKKDDVYDETISALLIHSNSAQGTKSTRLEPSRPQPRVDYVNP